MVCRIVRQESWINEVKFGYSQLGDILLGISSH